MRIPRQPSGQRVAARVIRYIDRVLLVLLAFRFILALFGANPLNPFAHLIYSWSLPFVSPFFNLFGYNVMYGVSHFELFTLIAMAVYWVVGEGLARLVTITRT